MAPILHGCLARSFDGHRLSRHLVATLLQGVNVTLGKLSVTTDSRQQRAKLYAFCGTNGRFEDVTDLGLSTAAVMSRSHPQGTMCFLRKISDGNRRH